MPTVEVVTINRDKVSDLNLSDAVFGAPINEQLLFAVVRYQLAKRRQGTHQVKGRAQVRGGGRKPYKQKGTGRARQGTIRAVQWRGGGVVHGPTPRSHGIKLNKKVRALALAGALSRRCAEQELVVVDQLALPEIKTRQVADLLARFELSDALVVDQIPPETFVKSARNLKQVTVLPVEGVNVLDILRRKTLVLTTRAVEALTARLGG